MLSSIEFFNLVSVYAFIMIMQKELNLVPIRNQFSSFKRKFLGAQSVVDQEDAHSIGDAFPKVIFGLGNPGERYVGTRHNTGVDCLDFIDARYGDGKKRKKEQIIKTVRMAGQNIDLVYPSAFYNDGGSSLVKFMKKNGYTNSQLLVICDDIDLEVGDVRMRLLGGNGGNNGMKSIINHLGTQQFPRIRIGIGRPRSVSGKPIHHSEEVANWVLAHPDKRDRDLINTVLDEVAVSIEIGVTNGNEAAMNSLNTRVGGSDNGQ